MGLTLKPDGVFNDEKPHIQPATTGKNFKMVYFHLKAGQKIPLHTTSSEVVVTVLKGKGNFLPVLMKISTHSLKVRASSTNLKNLTVLKL